MGERRETATLAGGCFWCTEAVFARLKGVVKVVPGYTGGSVPNPTYREVCDGETGHAEAVEITFDPDVISFAEILDVFWHIHNPTTLNRQGADVGEQYRSAIFYHDEDQRAVASASKRQAEEARLWPDPIVTEIVPSGAFYPAEGYHQDYYRRNRLQGYCMIVIDPKLEKLRKEFGHRLKEE
ncbi:MAG TPA: peptide-methionine (S)-S-oxide reductase MsrA [Geobacteraceae bacterium]